MIRLQTPKIRNLIEAMPVKCHRKVNRDAPSAPASDEHYFYKAVTPAVFSFMKGKVAYVEADEWARAKRALRQRWTRESAIGEKRPTSWKRTVPVLRSGENEFVKMYSQLTPPAETENLGGTVIVAEADTTWCSNVLLVPPTTDDRDVRALVEPLINAPLLRTMHEEIQRRITSARRKESHRRMLDRTVTGHFARCLAHALGIQVKNMEVLVPLQPLPESITAPVELNARLYEQFQAPTIDKLFFTIVPAHSLHELRRGVVRYVLADEWTGSSENVQVYTRASEDTRRAWGLPPGTVESMNEGRVQRDHALLVPPNTSSAMIRRIIDEAEATHPALQIYLQMLSDLGAEIKRGWEKAADMANAETKLRMRLLRGATASKRGFHCPGDHSNDLLFHPVHARLTEN